MGFRILPSSLFKMARCPSPEIKKSPNVLEKGLNSKLKRSLFQFKNNRLTKVVADNGSEFSG